MKVYRTAYRLVLTFYLPFFALYTALYLFEHQLLLTLRTVHWVFLTLALGCLFFPQRKIRYTDEQPTLAWPLWLMGITGFVSLLGAFFYFSQLFLGQVFISNTVQKTPTLPSFFTQLQNSGLFPWALVALFAITLQRAYRDEQRWGYFSHCMRPIFNSKPLNDVGKYCNTTIRYPIFLSLAITLMFIGLAGLFLFTHFSAIPLPSGINLLTLFASMLIFYVITNSPWPRYFNWLIKKGCPSLLSLLIMLCFGCTLFVFPLIFIQWAAKPTLINVNYFNPAAWSRFWEIVSVFIALSWLPLASVTIAVMSRGYQRWQIITATLLVPFIVMVSGGWEAPRDNVIISLGLIVCSLLLLVIFLQPWIISLIWRGLYPTSLIPREGKPIVYLRSLVIASITLIGIVWVTGVYVIALIFSAFTISATLMIMIAVIWSNGYRLRQGVARPALKLRS